MSAQPPATVEETQTEDPGSVATSVVSIKGFDKDLSCRGYKFEIGGTYTHEGKVEACKGGFHAIEGHPLEVFGYYAPAVSRYAQVTQSGEMSRNGGDSKLASAKITVDFELSISDLVKRTIKWVFDRSKPEGKAATGYRGAASATGDQGAASATGYRGAASATGDQGAASATGDRGAASATGDQGAASATGYRGAASATGDHSVAMAVGYEARAMATETNGLCLAHRDDDGNLIALRASRCGENGIKPGVWYTLSADGAFEEFEAP